MAETIYSSDSWSDYISEEIDGKSMKQRASDLFSDNSKFTVQDSMHVMGYSVAISQAQERGNRLVQDYTPETRRAYLEGVGEIIGISSFGAMLAARTMGASKDKAYVIGGKVGQIITINSQTSSKTLYQESKVIEKSALGAIKRWAKKMDLIVSDKDAKLITKRLITEVLYNEGQHNLSEKSAEELAEMGLIRVEGYTRKDGVKIKTHYRKK